MNKSLQMMVVLALGSFAMMVGCAGPSEEDDMEEGEGESTSTEALTTGKVAPACIDREVSSVQVEIVRFAHVRLTNNCKDKAHPDGYTARVRIEYGVLGKSHVTSCITMPPDAERNIDLRVGQKYWHTLSC